MSVAVFERVADSRHLVESKKKQTDRYNEISEDVTDHVQIAKI